MTTLLGDHSPLVFANWSYPKTSKLSPIFMTRGSFTAWGKMPVEVRSVLPLRPRDRGTTFLHDYISKEWL